MKRKKTNSFYERVGEKWNHEIRKRQKSYDLNLPDRIRHLRTVKQLTGVELCRRAGDLDPRTLTALEKGRIKNPSIKTLQSLSRGLNLPISDLFRDLELGSSRYFLRGSPKGEYHIDFPKLGVRLISFVPFIRDFFCGKMILAPRKTLGEGFLKQPIPIFISVLIGRFEITVEESKHPLKVGDNLFFNGHLRHSFCNPSQRESVLWLVTAPSFL